MGLEQVQAVQYTGAKVYYNEEGKMTSAYYYNDDEQNHTRQTLADEDGDGKIDSVSYFQDDENGNCLQARFDYNNDGEIDELLQFIYDDAGLIGRLTDKNNDGIFDIFDEFDSELNIIYTKDLTQ